MALWDDLGGDAVMGPLLRDFYARVAESPIARLFPSDLEQTFVRQFAFQSEFWGGPARYTPLRGHPRLRARHLPFPIRVEDAEEWLSCMRAAVAASGMIADQREQFIERMRQIAMAMVNTY
ncbi:MAG: globin [Planctomycetes bacterium]|nr:globin [Planctomycetota bacterium]